MIHDPYCHRMILVIRADSLVLDPELHASGFEDRWITNT